MDRIYVPAHGKPVMEIEGLVDLHIDKFKKIEDILTLLEEEKDRGTPTGSFFII